MRSIMALAALAAMAACSTAPDRKFQRDPNATANYLDCLIDMAAAMDDGYSDPKSIGIAIDGACMHEKMIFAQQGGESIRSNYEYGRYLDDVRNDQSMAIRVVLSYRNGEVSP